MASNVENGKGSNEGKQVRGRKEEKVGMEEEMKRKQG